MFLVTPGVRVRVLFLYLFYPAYLLYMALLQHVDKIYIAINDTKMRIKLEN